MEKIHFSYKNSMYVLFVLYPVSDIIASRSASYLRLKHGLFLILGFVLFCRSVLSRVCADCQVVRRISPLIYGVFCIVFPAIRLFSILELCIVSSRVLTKFSDGVSCVTVLILHFPFSLQQGIKYYSRSNDILLSWGADSNQSVDH